MSGGVGGHDWNDFGKVVGTCLGGVQNNVEKLIGNVGKSVGGTNQPFRSQ